MMIESDKNKSKVIDNNINGEYLTYEEYSATVALASLKHAKLDEQSFAKLEEQKSRFLKGKYKLGEGKSLVIGGRNNRIHDYDAIPISSSSTTTAPEVEGPSSGIRRRNNQILDGYQPPDIPPVAVLVDLIAECSKPWEKKLTESDLKKDQMRLCLCKDHVRRYMLKLLREDENTKQGIPTMAYDSEGNQYEMKFKLWGSKMYVITSSGWKKFCRVYGLVKEVDIVTVWMFRHRLTDKLCFVITTRRSPLNTQALVQGQ